MRSEPVASENDESLEQTATGFYEAQVTRACSKAKQVVISQLSLGGGQNV